jgi:LPXTG-site transpeptidase (sortase) family protein
MAHNASRSYHSGPKKSKSYTSIKAIALGIVLGLIFSGIVILLWKPWTTADFSNIIHSSNADQASQATETKFKDFGVEIGVNAPVTADVNGENKGEYNKSLVGGLAHYKGTELPGMGGNIFIFGHSSSDTDSGPYSKIFAKLNDLVIGDIISVYYKDNKYTYTVSGKKIIAADDLSPLNLTKIEQLTLMTCWPVGTKDKRLIVIAR